MFDLPEHELTWSVVGSWTPDDYDFDHHVTYRYQPQTRTDSILGSSFDPHGKPYDLTKWCFVRGFQLLITWKRPGDEFPEFADKELIDLRRIAMMTSPVVHRRRPGFLSAIDRGEVVGEQFYKGSDDDRLAPYVPAFWIRYPTRKGSIYEWEDTTKFIGALKSRINKFQKANKPDQDDAYQRPSMRRQSTGN